MPLLSPYLIVQPAITLLPLLPSPEEIHLLNTYTQEAHTTHPITEISINLSHSQPFHLPYIPPQTPPLYYLHLSGLDPFNLELTVRER